MTDDVIEVLADRRRWGIVRDGVRLLSDLPDESVDAVITDPPYSSGGLHKGDRSAGTNTKYVNSGQVHTYAPFDGDQRDQRSYLLWCTLWLGEAYRATRAGGVCVLYTDWRQLPTTTDALQMAGWLWRGILPWLKPPGGYRPGPGFANRCEYVVWGTRGEYSGPASAMGALDDAAPRAGRDEGKEHPTQKPLASVRLLMGAVPEGGIVVDPFAGSGTTGIAALLTGRRALLAEQSDHYRATASERMGAAQGAPTSGRLALFT